MKRLLLIPLVIVALFACDKKETPVTPDTPPVTPDTPVVSSDSLVLLSYDSATVSVIATPGDSLSTYVLQVWLVEDYILDYGNDFSDAAVSAALSSYLDLCLQWQMQFPIFEGVETSSVYEWFDQPFYGVEHIAMAASYDEQTRKVNGQVSFIRFITPAR